MQDLGRLLREPWLLISILLIFAMLGIFIILPLIKVVDMSVASDGSPFEIYTNLFKSWYMRRAFTNSLLMGALSALTSVVVGFILAYTVTRVNIPFKRLIDMIAIIPIISPPFVSSLSILLLFGNNGLITYNLFGIRNFPIYGIRGLLLAQTVTFFPVAYLSLKGVLEAINPALEDAAFDLGASRWTVFRKITLPLAVPGIASAMLVVFIESLADFGNPLVLAGSAFPTLAVQAYLQITGMYDLPGGAALAVTLLIPSITAFVLQKYWVSRKSYVTVSGKPTRSTVKAVGPVMRWVLFGFAMAICVIVLGFYGVIVVGAFSKAWGFDYGFTLRNFTYVLDVGFETILDTLTVAVTSTPISGLIGMFIAFLVVRKRFLGRSAMEFTSMLSFALPGTVIGIGYILAFNQRPFLLTGTLTILVANFVFRYVPVGIQNGIAALHQIDPGIEEAATNLGANSQTVFRRITLPLISPAFFSGLVFAFVRAMTAISAAIFLVSADWNLMTVQILNQVGSGRLGAAAAFSLLLVGIIVVAIIVIRLIVDRLFGVRFETRF
ncbi:MAG TPA: iron ABC transporter permease [Firmicutes bacterium]|jgi:iron(III) transport system permease protein|nr:MAG: ABC transporter permease [Peptococcaceae bacterium 1109]HHT72939.1 iron ABC transporter permease [Bacillota bacterium]